MSITNTPRRRRARNRVAVPAATAVLAAGIAQMSAPAAAQVNQNDSGPVCTLATPQPANTPQSCSAGASGGGNSQSSGNGKADPLPETIVINDTKPGPGDFEGHGGRPLGTRPSFDTGSDPGEDSGGPGSGGAGGRGRMDWAAREREMKLRAGECARIASEIDRAYAKLSLLAGANVLNAQMRERGSRRKEVEIPLGEYVENVYDLMLGPANKWIWQPYDSASAALEKMTRNLNNLLADWKGKPAAKGGKKISCADVYVNPGTEH